jgi:hypothetical protein
MKIIITESQYNRILREEEEQKVLHIPSLKFFNNNWVELQKFLKSKGNPPYSIGGDLDLSETPIQTLGHLVFISGDLLLGYSNIQYLWKLKSVGGSLSLRNTNVRDLGFFGDLQSVGGYLNLIETPLSRDYTEKEIRQVISVGDKIYMTNLET